MSEQAEIALRIAEETYSAREKQQFDSIDKAKFTPKVMGQERFDAYFYANFDLRTEAREAGMERGMDRQGAKDLSDKAVRCLHIHLAEGLDLAEAMDIAMTRIGVIGDIYAFFDVKRPEIDGPVTREM